MKKVIALIGVCLILAIQIMYAAAAAIPEKGKSLDFFQ